MITHLGPFIMEILVGIVFGYILYFLFIGIGFIISFAQKLFNIAAGLEPISIDSQIYGGSDNPDMVIGLMRNDTINKVFFTILGVCLVLLVIFTIIAVIKTEFSLKYTSKAPIISRALTSLANFFIIPIMFLVGITATSGLLRVVSGVWESGTPNSLTYKCFEVGSKAANRARNDTKFAQYLIGGDWIGQVTTSGGGSSGGGGGTLSGTPNLGDLYESSSSVSAAENFQDHNPFATLSEIEVADFIDKIFENSFGSEANFLLGIEMKDFNYEKQCERADDNLYVDWHTALMGYPNLNERISIYNIKAVNYFYEFMNFNYILALGAAIVVAWNMLGICILLFKRVFEMLIIFLLSPIMTAVAPLDNGNAEKKLRGEFMKRLFSVIGPVFAYNLFFIIIGIFSEINPFKNMTGNFFQQYIAPVVLVVFDLMFELLVIIVALGLLKTANSMFTSMLGMEDLVSQSDATMKKTIGTTQKVALGATAGITMAAKGTAQSIKGIKSVGGYAVNAANAARIRGIDKDEEKFQYKKEAALEDLEKKTERHEKFRDDGDVLDALGAKFSKNRAKAKVDRFNKREKDLERYRGSDEYKIKKAKERIEGLSSQEGGTQHEEAARLASIKEEEDKIKTLKASQSQARKDKLAGSFLGRKVIGFGHEVKDVFGVTAGQMGERMRESAFGLTGEGAQKAMNLFIDKNERKSFYKSSKDISADKEKEDKFSKEFSEGKGAELSMLKKVVASEKGEDVKKEYTKLADVLAKTIKDGVLSEQLAARRNLERFETKHGITKNAEIMQASINNMNNPNHDKNMELLNSYLSNARKEAEDKGIKEAAEQSERQAKANVEALENVMKDPIVEMTKVLKDMKTSDAKHSALLQRELNAVASGLKSMSEFMKGNQDQGKK